MTEQLGLFDSRNAFAPVEAAQAPLSIRQSNRARYLTLRMKPPHTLELVVPRGTRAREVAAFVQAHQQWIERARRELAARRPLRTEGLPTQIELKASGERWRVEYRHDATKRARCRAHGWTLEVSVRDAQHRDAPAALREWLLDHAAERLAPWLMREAVVVGHRPTSVQVRLQRTRWGSCSTSGTVSLNAALLFVAPEVVRYLLVHELCHFISLNHSRKFWHAVARFEPDYEALDRRLTAAWDEIPHWAHPEAC
ncbi:MAG TPA: SprT family zinc-dependent metalloprotease [Gammaproteobacteria bacterium]|nr:SprT family zinc-dependent metalloprotease [Gammaproteobacteria bacterium]